jgi:hypothetical protein
MSASEATLLPSYDELYKAQQHIRFTPGTMRLFWTLDGPLTTAIQVMEDFWNPDSLELYFRESVDGSSWHPISELPLTDPKLSSVKVRVYELNEWETSGSRRIMATSTSIPISVISGATSSRSGYFQRDTGEGMKKVRTTMCCGTRRPLGKAAELEVKPTVSGKEFVTVHDYVSAVHPWLMSLREDISWAINVYESDPLPADTKLMVNYTALDCLMIEEPALWINSVRHRPY